jgi:hypothetical protein
MRAMPTATMPWCGSLASAAGWRKVPGLGKGQDPLQPDRQAVGRQPMPYRQDRPTAEATACLGHSPDSLHQSPSAPQVAMTPSALVMYPECVLLLHYRTENAPWRVF